jgi:hypothetical protein
MGNLATSVIGICSHTQFNLSPINLGRLYQELNNPGSLTKANRQNTGSRWVKATGMADMPFSGQPFYQGHNAKRGLTPGLIDIQYAIHN